MGTELTIADLFEKRILITGGSTGIGAAVAAAFAGQGSRVIIQYNENREAAEALQQAYPGTLTTLQANLSQSGAARELVEKAAIRLGGLDGIINNAGGMLGRIPTTQVSPEHFNRVLELNAKSVWESTVAAYPYLKKSGDSFVINTTSVAARNGGGGGAVIYAAAKAFVSSLTRGQAKEFVGDGIRVNAVAPGLIQTPFHDRYTSPEILAAQRATIPMKREGTPAECVGAFLFLASTAMSGYITGQVIEVNGGQLMP